MSVELIGILVSGVISLATLVSQMHHNYQSDDFKSECGCCSVSRVRTDHTEKRDSEEDESSEGSV